MFRRNFVWCLTITGASVLMLADVQAASITLNRPMAGSEYALNAPIQYRGVGS